MALQFTEHDHLQHARHNEAFLDHLIESVLESRSEFADWALVVCFYAALHYTKAALVRDLRMSATTHRSYEDAGGGDRKGHTDLVRIHLPALGAIYSEMFDLSQDARYRGFYKMPGHAVAEVKRQRRRLEDVKTACGYGG